MTQRENNPNMTAPSTRPSGKRHFSLIRDFSLADFITLANAASGAAAVFAVMRYLVSGDKTYLWVAFGLLPFALAFDYFDGWVARWRRKSSPYGAHLDSLSDIISFGVAPAAIAFAVGMRGGWDTIVLLYFVTCGVSRLARFNATSSELADDTGKVRYFEGAPIPSSLLFVAILAVLAMKGFMLESLPFGVFAIGPFDFHPLVLLFAISGSAMVSKTLRVPKL
ncbi:MAG: CDP-alcohol phosphatidyltransferase family protein [Polyangiaceae bacterium]|nr:CDP-alcohol phosphatidyltransferase family protein [Polyangiaceae bacterium]